MQKTTRYEYKITLPRCQTTTELWRKKMALKRWIRWNDHEAEVFIEETNHPVVIVRVNQELVEMFESGKNPNPRLIASIEENTEQVED